MASYLEQGLGRDEQIVATGNITGWIWLGPIILTVITFGILCPLLLFPLLRQKTTELAVTNKRVVAKFGFISRRTIELRIQKIESIRVSQSLLGRIGNFGTIMIHGTGGATTPIPEIADPMAFKAAVERVIDRYEDQAGAAIVVRERA